LARAGRSPEELAQVEPKAQLMRNWVGELYHTQDQRGFRFSSTATGNLEATGDTAVDSIRRSTKMGMMRRPNC
jgi:hypothetical protein